MNGKILENLPRYILFLLVFILPIWVLPYTIYPLELNKAFLFYFLIILAALFWFISILQKASLRLPKSAALLALAAVIVVWAASSFFSPNQNLSLLGAGQEIGTFFSLVLLGLALLIASAIFQSEIKAIIFYAALFASSLAVFIFQFLRAGLNITLYPWNIFPAKISNTIGSWNEVGIFFGLISLLTVVFLELLPLGKRLKPFLFLMLAVSLIAVAFVNFETVWIVFGSLLVVFLVYFFSTRHISGAEPVRRKKFMRFAIFALLIAVFFIMARTMLGDFLSSQGMNSIEIRPSLAATWQVVKNVLKENILLGSGPNTFLYDWLKFKPININLTQFWATSFTFGFSTLLTFLATGGILTGIAWAVFLLLMLFYGLKVLANPDSENEFRQGLLIASFFGSLYLWIFTIIYAPSFFLVALTFLLTGVFIALLCQDGKIKSIEVSFANKPKWGFVSSLVIVLLMIAAVASFYLLFQKYWAAYSFGNAIAVINSAGKVDDAENLVTRSVRLDPQDKYYRTLSDIGLLKIQQLAARTDLPPEELQVQFQNILVATIGNAQNAINSNPLDFSNWMSLAGVYEAVIPLKIAGASDASINAYKEAAKRAPLDPGPLFAEARVEIQANNTEAAISLLNSTINIKSDYAPALFLLAQLEAQKGNVKEAIRRTEQAFYLAPNDVGVLFQLGLLYYQDQNYDNSRLVFERAVALNPNYSNARYFLGLIYDRAGRKQDAIDQFQKIQELNPDNQEVRQILANLIKGKPALNNISPPQPSPEKRTEPPLKEKTQ